MSWVQRREACPDFITSQGLVALGLQCKAVRGQRHHPYRQKAAVAGAALRGSRHPPREAGVLQGHVGRQGTGEGAERT